jgi:hypothetical protein
MAQPNLSLLTKEQLAELESVEEHPEGCTCKVCQQWLDLVPEFDYDY